MQNNIFLYTRLNNDRIETIHQLLNDHELRDKKLGFVAHNFNDVLTICSCVDYEYNDAVVITYRFENLNELVNCDIIVFYDVYSHVEKSGEQIIDFIKNNPSKLFIIDTILPKEP